MIQRQVPNGEYILHADITSGKSKVAIPILQLLASKASIGTSVLVCSYKYSPSEILQRVSQVKDIQVLPDGKVGAAEEGKVYEIGEYRFLYSKEHFFNAVFVCLAGSDYFGNGSTGASLYLTVNLIKSSLMKIGIDGIVSANISGGKNDMGETYLHFSPAIAQQVYDSEFVDADFKDPEGLTETMQEWFSFASSSAAKKSGGCYVATAVYGSYDCPQVWTLRRYRDNDLAMTWYGRAFIKLYYAISPSLVKLFGNTSWFQKYWRNRLDKLIDKLQKGGYSSTPYDDKW